MYTSVGVGALVGALATGWVAHVRRQGRAVVIAVVVWGASITAFGLVKSLPVALVLLAVAGWADVVSAVFRNMILQLRVPDRLRGRMNAIQVAVVSGGPRLGDLESGGVATAVSPSFSVVSGGVACIVAAVAVTIALPVFWRLRLSSGELGPASSAPASSPQVLSPAEASPRPTPAARPLPKKVSPPAQAPSLAACCEFPPPMR